MEVKLLICADSFAVDLRRGSISAFHIFEQINSPSFPVVLPRISVAVLSTRRQEEPMNIQAQLQMHLGDQQLFAGPMPINFNQRLFARNIADLQGIVIQMPGTLRVILKNGEQVLSSWNIPVNQVGQPVVQAQPVPAAPNPVHE